MLVFAHTKPGPPPGATAELALDAALGAAIGFDMAAGAGVAGVAAAGVAVLDAYQSFTPLWPEQAPLLVAPE